jgi:hypothetical protein
VSDETEIWGELSQNQFQAQLANLIAHYGQPLKSKRLALQADYFDRHDLDTRIRITDGKAELLQKIGAWEATTRQELHVPLPLSAPEILNLYKLLVNQLPPNNRQTNIIQYQNYIFNQPDVEIKLGEQTGKQTAYHYELEAKSLNANLEQKRLDLKLPAPLKQSDEMFWASWNKRVNLDYFDLAETELIDLIEKYLDAGH